MIRVMQSSEWIPSDGIKLELNAQKTVRSLNNMLVVAGPGAGKTELLAQRACFLLQTNICPYPQKILAISFKKDAAHNLAERVKKRCGEAFSKRFISKTYDAFAKDLIDRFSEAIPISYKPNQGYNIARESRERNDIRVAYELCSYPIPRTRGSNEWLSARLVNGKLPIALDGYTENVWDILLHGRDRVEPCLTFQMISRLAEYLIRSNPILQKTLQQAYSFTFLDEFQDTTDIQYDLVKTCFLNSSTVITAVGDTKQRIMLWARAKRDVFSNYLEDFSAAKTKLVFNHRSAPRLVHIQKLLYSSLNEDVIEITTSNKWKQDDGMAELWYFNCDEQEAQLLAAEIEKYIKVEKIDPNDICILVKFWVDDYAALLIKALSKRGINSRNEGIFQDLLKEECVMICVYMVILAYSRRSPDAWIYIIELMKSIMGFDSDTAEEKIYELQKDVSAFCHRLAKNLAEVDGEESLEEAFIGIMHYVGIEALKTNFPQYKNETYLFDKLSEISGYIWDEYIKRGHWVSAIEAFMGKNTVPIMTIHKSKGLEYDTVIFLGLEDGAFWSFNEQAEEDRCAFFVALSRAKRRVIFTFCHYREIRNRWTEQSKVTIKEFYDVLDRSGVLRIKDVRGK